MKAVAAHAFGGDIAAAGRRSGPSGWLRWKAVSKQTTCGTCGWAANYGGCRRALNGWLQRGERDEARQVASTPRRRKRVGVGRSPPCTTRCAQCGVRSSVEVGEHALLRFMCLSSGMSAKVGRSFSCRLQAAVDPGRLPAKWMAHLLMRFWRRPRVAAETLGGHRAPSNEGESLMSTSDVETRIPGVTAALRSCVREQRSQRR